MMKPTLEGRMLQALDLAAEDCVLEIGTGSGFITACLGYLARAVVSIDIHADFVERARSRFVGGDYANISVQQADVCHFEPGRQFDAVRSEEHTSELQSLMRISYAVFCLKKKKKKNIRQSNQ